LTALLLLCHDFVGLFASTSTGAQRSAHSNQKNYRQMSQPLLLLMLPNNVYMVSVKHSKPLVIKQESTNYDVAASELSYLLCSIIDAVAFSSKEEKSFWTGFAGIL
jgi:hypothetical protein